MKLGNLFAKSHALQYPKEKMHINGLSLRTRFNFLQCSGRHLRDEILGW